MWKIEPYGNNAYIKNVKFSEYMYVPDYRSKSSLKYDDERRRVFTWIRGSKDSQSVWKIEDCGSISNKSDIQQLESKVSLDFDFHKTIKAKKRANGAQTSVLSGKLQRDFYLSRKPLAIDSSNQPEIATSNASQKSSWINDLFCWVKSSIGGLLDSQSSTTTKSPILQVDAPVDINGTIMLLDLLIRKVTGQKYISTVDQSISPLEAQGYALSITKGFEKVVEQAALKSGISMHRLNIDYMGMQKEITRKVMSGKFNEISGILKSYAEKACPGEEAGKLSPKKFEKFIAQFNKGLLNQSIEQILHNRDGRLEVDSVKKQQMSLEPQSYLSNASVHSHSKVSTCLSEIGVIKLENNLSR
ncbi:MAG: latrotoxin-related protein [Wolbachia sp.]